MSRWTLLGGLLTLLAAALYPFVRHVIVVGGLLETFVNTNQEGCSIVHDPLLNGCEDGQMIPGTNVAVLACAVDVYQRLLWFPPTQARNVSAKGPGALVLFDLSTGKATRLQLEGRSEPFFQPHGLSLVQDPDSEDRILIGVVNHALSGSRLEFFEHKRDSTKARLFNTFEDSVLLPNPNDVLLIDRQRFYATNSVKYSSGPMHFIEKYLAQPWGHIIYHDRKARLPSRIVADNLQYANGLAMTADSSKLFAVSTVGSFLHVYERKPGSGSLRPIERVKLPLMGDNPSVRQETGEVYVAGHGHALKYGAHSKDPTVASPSVVVKVSEAEGESVFYGHRYQVQRVLVDDGRTVPGTSFALVHGGKTLVGGAFNSGVYWCREKAQSLVP